MFHLGTLYREIYIRSSNPASKMYNISVKSNRDDKTTLNKTSTLNNPNMFSTRNTTNMFSTLHATKKMFNAGLLTFSDVSCTPVNVSLLLFNRIFKTGSSSLESHLNRIHVKNKFLMRIWTTEDWYGKNPSKTYPKFIENFSRQTRYRVGAFIPHFYFRDDLAVTNRHTYINLVRHPVERVISHYFYMRNSKLRSKERLLEFRLRGQWNESLRDCVMHQHLECRDNISCILTPPAKILQGNYPP